MAALTVIPLIGTLGILFIGFNVMIITLLILTIVFGVIRLVKKKFTKTFIILLILTIILAFIDYKIINNNPDESKEKDEWSILELLLKNGGKSRCANL